MAMDFKPEFPQVFNMVDYFVDANLRAGRGNKTAIRWAAHKDGEAGKGREAGEWTYAKAAEMVNRAGSGFLKLGLQPEQRFLTVLFDGPEFAATWFGGIKGGGVATQVNPLLPAEDYAYYLNYTKAPIAIIDAHCLTAFESVLDKARYLKHLVVVNGDAGRHTPWQQLVDSGKPELECAPTDKDDPAVWLFTSGSTGKPKAALHPHFHFPYNTECYAKRVVGYNETFVTLSVPKLFFGYATGTNLMFPFAVGGTACLFGPHATPERITALVEHFGATFLTHVPTMMNKMLAMAEAGDGRLRRQLKTLKLGVTAGEALPPSLYEKWVATTGVELLDGIGSAESFHIYISNYPGDVKASSLGRIVPGYEARVCDDDGRELADGEIGTLHVTGDTAALMYWSDYKKSTQVLKGGTIVSGDKFMRDKEGYYYFSGRADDLLKVGGIWVAPQEIEDCMLRHESVAEVCVIGVDPGDGLVVPKALVVLKPGYRRGVQLGEELQQFVKEKLARYKYPRMVEFRDSLPKNDRGKIDRKALKG